MGQLKLNRGWEKLVAEHASVKDGAKRLGGAIAEDARGRTTAQTGAARESIQVVEVDGVTYVVGGAGGEGWWIVFQEFGGSGFRPPPMPIRRAASKYGRSEQGR